MAITILRNQPIDFNPVSEDPDCGCTGKNFCQLIDPTDATQFQIGSSDLIENGDFDAEGSGWDTQTPLTVEIVSISNESSAGACDGSVDILITNYTGTITFRINGSGASFPISPSSTFTNLCEGCKFVTFEDSAGKQASIEFCLVENIDCGLYDSTDELLLFTTAQLLNCLTSDFI